MPIDHIFGMMRSAVFDLDGTLIDSLDVWNQVDVALAAELGLTLISPATLYSLRETTLRQFARTDNAYVAWCRLLGEMAKSPMSAEKIHDRRYQLSRVALERDMRYRPGAVEFVNALRKNPVGMAIATTTRRANVEIYGHKNKVMMAELPLTEVFNPIITREDVRAMKPSPECYQLAIDRLGCAPFEAVAFEDSLVGVESAKAAGLSVIAIRERHSKDDAEKIAAKADWVFEDWHEALEALPWR